MKICKIEVGLVHLHRSAIRELGTTDVEALLVTLDGLNGASTLDEVRNLTTRAETTVVGRNVNTRGGQAEQRDITHVTP